jgi:hypothetical protein
MDPAQHGHARSHLPVVLLIIPMKKRDGQTLMVCYNEENNTPFSS